MQTKQSPSGERAQWVIPRPKRLKQDPSRPSAIESNIRPQTRYDQLTSSSQTESKVPYHYIDRRDISPDTPEPDYIGLSTPDQLKIDLPLCKTICIFVEQHLKDLQEHQHAIERARTNCNLHSSREFNGRSTPSRSDALKIKVRDEQTKAIETIKQLTNYLRELSIMKSQFDSAPKQVEVEIVNKLSDVRLDIIQALNDFVLSNNDIDVPITDNFEDFNYQEYDLCTDAIRNSAQVYPANVSHRLSSNSESTHVCPPISESTSIILSDNQDDALLLEQSSAMSSSDNQIALLEKRRRDIQKLTKDTIELRRLFSDFYNLVKIQGEQVDKIEDNIVITTHRISEGQHNLQKAVKNLTILVPVTGCITGALIGGPIGLAVGSKLGAVSIVCAASLFGLISSYSAQKCITLNKTRDD